MEIKGVIVDDFGMDYSDIDCQRYKKLTSLLIFVNKYKNDSSFLALPISLLSEKIITNGGLCKPRKM